MEENSQQKQKLTRKRINPTHRWTESQVLHLLQAVSDMVKETPESFEKPTDQRFYEKVHVSTPALQCILWVALKSKMRHLKSYFLSAVAWKGKTGAGLLANGDDSSVSAYIYKICPHWDLLNDIFGQRKNVNPGVIFESIHNVETLLDTPEMSSSLTENCECFESTIFEVCDDSVDPPTTSISHFNANPEPSTPQSAFNVRNLKKKTKFDNPFNKLLVIQEKRLKLEVDKLELEKEKEKNQMELKKIELQNQFELQKIEIEAKKQEQLEIEKLKLESEERIKIFEIKSKCSYK